LRLLDTIADIDAAGEAWRALERRCPGRRNYFQSFDWCRGWLAHAGADSRPHIVTAWQGADLAAVWPLMRHRQSRLEKIEPVGGTLAQYSGIIHDPALIDAAGLAQVVAYGLAPGRGDVAEFRAVPEDSPLVAALRAQPGIVRGPDDTSYFLDLSKFPSSADYLATRNRMQRRGRERKRKALMQEHGDVTFDVVWSGESEFEPLVRHAIAMKTVWLHETGRPNANGPTEDENFFAGLKGDRASLQGAMVSVVRAGGRPASIELGFIRNRHYYSFIGAFDWNLGAYSPGKLQMEGLVCWLIDHDVQTFDLLAYWTQYKGDWSDSTNAVYSFAQPFTWKGRLYAEAWMRTLRPAMKRAFYAVPARLRRWMVGLKPAAALLIFV
jgi:CelD/BcsL family acetyltransferase involved in cellulose biosynthesis